MKTVKENNIKSKLQEQYKQKINQNQQKVNYVKNVNNPTQFKNVKLIQSKTISSQGIQHIKSNRHIQKYKTSKQASTGLSIMKAQSKIISIKCSLKNVQKDEQEAYPLILQNGQQLTKKMKMQVQMDIKQGIKESNYFDESNNDQLLTKLIQYNNKQQLNMSMGNIDQFQTTQVKTYLYDRNLNNKLINNS